jgi:hypothetical protein
MSMPSETRFTVTIPAGSPTTFAVAIPAPVSGVINKLLVLQTSGSLGGFTYSLYNSALAYPPGPNPVAAIAADSYQVVPPHVVASAKDRWQGSAPFDGLFNLKYGYCNQDQTSTNRAQKLYLLLTIPGGGAGNTFVVSMTIIDTLTN